MYSYRVYNPKHDLPVAVFNTFDEAAALIERPGYEGFVIEEFNLNTEETSGIFPVLEGDL